MLFLNGGPTTGEFNSGIGAGIENERFGIISIYFELKDIELELKYFELN